MYWSYWAHGVVIMGEELVTLEPTVAKIQFPYSTYMMVSLVSVEEVRCHTAGDDLVEGVGLQVRLQQEEPLVHGLQVAQELSHGGGLGYYRNLQHSVLSASGSGGEALLKQIHKTISYIIEQ